MAVQPELTPGESVLWAGRPSTRVVFQWKANEPLLGFSLIGGVFAILWEIAAIWSLWSIPSPKSLFMVLLGIPLVLTGQYFIWGRFFSDARKKERTYYAVTTRRVIAVQNFRTRRVASADINALPALTKERRLGGVGTLRFGPAPILYARRWSEMTADKWEVWDALSIKSGPVFVDIEEVDSVHQLISGLQAKTSEAEVAAILRGRRTTQ